MMDVGAAKFDWHRLWKAMPVAAMLASGGCIQVNAPEKPIEIVLTINIRQEVVYRLDRDAKELIEQNTEIF